MPLPVSGPISLDDIHVEAGGTTGTLANINDADIRALIGASAGDLMNFSDFYGAGGGTNVNVSGLQGSSSVGSVTVNIPSLLAGFAYTNIYTAGEYITSSGASGLDANSPTGNSFTYQGVTCHINALVNSTALGGVQFHIQTSGTAVTFSSTDTSWSTVKVWLNQSNNTGSPDITLNRASADSVVLGQNGTTTATIIFNYNSGSYPYATYFGTTVSPGSTNFLELE